MTSVFDLPPSDLVPPTLEAFFDQVGDPALTFSLDAGELVLPLGVLTCCRVVHQAHCAHHVALSLIGCYFTVRYPDAEDRDWAPVKQVFPGDVLARPRDLAGAVEATALLASATAQAGGGQISTLTFDVWLLNLEQAEVWRYLMAERQEVETAVLEGSDPLTTAAIEALPVRILSDPADGPEVAQVLADPSFRHVKAYARRVLVLPSEIGHDDQARYITNEVWGDADVVPPAVEAIMRRPDDDGSEVPW